MSSSFVTVGVVFQANEWHLTFRTRSHDGGRFLDVAFAIASQVLHSGRVATVRACRGIRFMPKLSQYEHGGVIFWIRGAGCDSRVSFTPCTKDLASPFPAQALAQELQEVDIGKTDWGGVGGGGSLLCTVSIHQI